MALRVWLPLNENEENKGLSNLVFKNSGATIDSSGKIGPCYSFDGTDDRLSCLEPVAWTYPLSICGWFYPTNVAGTLTQYFISFNKDGNGTAGHAIGVGTLNGGSALTIWAGGATYSANTTLVNNTWYHFVVTVDENKQYKFYLNGELKTSGSCGNNPGSNWLTIGARSNSTSGGTASANYYFQGKMNDIRIYDECLSQKQIKEISKGLICHYKLTGVGANENLAKNTITTSPSGFYDYTGKATASRFNDEKVCTSVYKIDFPEDSETYSNYNTYVTVPRDSSAVVQDGRTYTLSFKIKASKPLENYRLFYEFNNSSVDTNIGTEWKKLF